MKKYVTKLPVLNLIFSVILIAMAVLTLIFQADVIGLLEYFMAGVIFIYAILFFRRNIAYYKNQTAKILISVQLLLSILIIVMLIGTEIVTSTVAIGAILYLKGAMFLLIYVYLKKSLPVEMYLFKLVLITLGVYLIFTTQTFESYLIWALAGLFVLYAIFFIYYALKQFKANKLKIETKTETDKVILETKKAETFTKQALLNKHVDELRTMCKARNIKGYSSMRKETLVEKLWLYEHEGN